MKVALVTRTKNRNHYIKFFIEYYLKLKCDSIFLIDMNEDNTLENICVNYNNVFIKKYIFDVQEDIQLQKILFEIINEYDYDYIINVDDDEFIYLQDYDNIHDFINTYKEYGILYLIWKIYSDNNYIFNDELPNSIDNVIENFKEESLYKPINNDRINQYHEEFYWTKYIVKTSVIKEAELNNYYFGTHHLEVPNHNVHENKAKLFLDDYEKYHIKHYRTKNFEEYLKDKILSNNMMYQTNITFKEHNIIDNYKIFNKMDDKKLEKINKCLEKYNVKL